jgi:hypothetical protein
VPTRINACERIGGYGTKRFSQIRIVSLTSTGPVRIWMVPCTRFGAMPASTYPHRRYSAWAGALSALTPRRSRSKPRVRVHRSVQGVHARAFSALPSHKVDPVALVQPRQAENCRDRFDLGFLKCSDLSHATQIARSRSRSLMPANFDQVTGVGYCGVARTSSEFSTGTFRFTPSIAT